MPTSLLQILNDLLLALLLLFFLRVLRAVWVQTKPAPVPAAAPVAAAQPRQAAPQKGRLRVVQPQEGEPFDVGDEVTIGRAPGCGISLPDNAVSQLHARLFRRDGKLYVEDLGSTNGTWVNGGRVSGPQALRRGDRVQVGATVMEVGR